jgi:uncharacterized protein with HEPN domain
MKRRSDKLLLEDMLSAIDQIEKYLEGISFEDFCHDQMRQDAVVRRLEVIGEAARFLSEDFRSRYPQIPWQDIIGMRHKLAHDYFEVDLRVVWDTVQFDLPQLKLWLQEILERGEG